MRLIVGVLSLLVVAAVVMMVAKQQLQAVGKVPSGAPVAPASSTGSAGATGTPPPTVAEGAKQIQRKVADDVTRALQQGSQRASEAQ